MKKSTRAFVLLLLMVTGLLLNFPETVNSQHKVPAPIQLYTLDGGQLDFKNMGIFYDTGEHEGETGKMAVPCYLIHPESKGNYRTLCGRLRGYAGISKIS